MLLEKWYLWDATCVCRRPNGAIEEANIIRKCVIVSGVDSGCEKNARMWHIKRQFYFSIIYQFFGFFFLYMFYTRSIFCSIFLRCLQLRLVFFPISFTFFSSCFFSNHRNRRDDHDALNIIYQSVGPLFMIMRDHVSFSTLRSGVRYGDPAKHCGYSYYFLNDLWRANRWCMPESRFPCVVHYKYELNLRNHI